MPPSTLTFVKQINIVLQLLGAEVSHIPSFVALQKIPGSSIMYCTAGTATGPQQGRVP